MIASLLVGEAEILLLSYSRRNGAYRRIDVYADFAPDSKVLFESLDSTFEAAPFDLSFDSKLP